jgi:hypothetical protein
MIDEHTRTDDDKDAPVDDEYLPDPDAAPTVEGRIEQARAEMKKLMRASLYATLVMGAAFVAWDLVKGPDMRNTLGYLCGAGAATLNMWSIGGAFYGIMRETAGRSLMGILGSFFGLVVLAVIVVLTHKEWVLGFAVGLTTPAVAGLFYARTLKQR